MRRRCWRTRQAATCRPLALSARMLAFWLASCAVTKAVARPSKAFAILVSTSRGVSSPSASCQQGGVQGCRGNCVQEGGRYLRVHLRGSVNGQLQGVYGSLWVSKMYFTVLPNGVAKLRLAHFQAPGLSKRWWTPTAPRFWTQPWRPAQGRDNGPWPAAKAQALSLEGVSRSSVQHLTSSCEGFEV